jgi:hypothetical protein
MKADARSAETADTQNADKVTTKLGFLEENKTEKPLPV